MQNYFHSFPRPNHYYDANSKHLIRIPPSTKDNEIGFEILSLILNYGLLCSPEKFRLYPAFDSDNIHKKKLLAANKPFRTITQSRASFTLQTYYELSKEYSIGQNNNYQFHSHADLFGHFSIGIDPIKSRDFGILPISYYYKHKHSSTEETIEGLSLQMLSRLNEISDIFSILSYIEAKLYDTELPVLAENDLKNIGVDILFEDDIKDKISGTNKEIAEFIFSFFNTDRVASWSIVGFINMLLSVYQIADSTLETAPLAFFQQREWRLIYHHRKEMHWFSLGKNHEIIDPNLNYERYTEERETILKFLERTDSNLLSDRNKPINKLQNCWVLNQLDGMHFRNYIKEIVVPESFLDRTQDLIAKLPFHNHVPTLKVLPKKWRIKVINNQPVIS